MRQWYALEDHRLVTAGTGAVGGADLGALAVVDRRMGVGFSEFPARAGVVDVTSILEGGG